MPEKNLFHSIPNVEKSHIGSISMVGWNTLELNQCGKSFHTAYPGHRESAPAASCTEPFRGRRLLRWTVLCSSWRCPCRINDVSEFSQDLPRVEGRFSITSKHMIGQFCAQVEYQIIQASSNGNIETNNNITRWTFECSSGSPTPHPWPWRCRRHCCAPLFCLQRAVRRWVSETSSRDQSWDIMRLHPTYPHLLPKQFS